MLSSFEGRNAPLYMLYSDWPLCLIRTLLCRHTNVQLYVFKLPSSNFLYVLTGWAHVVCALYIPEVRFGNVTTMEPIILASVPHDRFCKVLQTCFIL